ncbi:PHP domain-containing protein [Nanoarchaeota archaeon]
MRIDLHTHTHYSDGTANPKHVVKTALERKVKYLAITDHNTVAGVKEAKNAAKNKDLILIPGIEIDIKISSSEDSVHLVGLYLNTKSKDLTKIIDKLVKAKIFKNKKRLAKVNNYFGSNITNEDIKRKTKGVPGSPHIAMVLQDQKYTKSLKEGIKLLIKGGACNVSLQEKMIHAKEAIKAIHKSGGLAILAHLSAYKNEKKFTTYKEQERLVKELKNYGLDGLEIYIPGVSKGELAFGKKLCKKYNLKVSCGSDFHDEGLLKKNKIGHFNLKKKEITILKD